MTSFASPAIRVRRRVDIDYDVWSHLYDRLKEPLADTAVTLRWGAHLMQIERVPSGGLLTIERHGRLTTTTGHRYLPDALGAPTVDVVDLDEGVATILRALVDEGLVRWADLPLAWRPEEWWQAQETNAAPRRRWSRAALVAALDVRGVRSTAGVGDEVLVAVAGADDWLVIDPHEGTIHFEGALLPATGNLVASVVHHQVAIARERIGIPADGEAAGVGCPDVRPTTRTPDAGEPAEQLAHVDLEPKRTPAAGGRDPHDHRTIDLEDLIAERAWRGRLEDAMRAERPEHRLCRVDRARRRADMIRWVPPANACAGTSYYQHGIGTSANGTVRGWDVAKPRRADTPVRLIIALWGTGLGVRPIGGVLGNVPKSVIGERIKEAQAERPGCEAVRVADLVAEFGLSALTTL